MHVAYAFCTNLTIIDTPGLVQSARKDEPAAMVAEIRAMVAEQAAPAHRIILFLQQSTVEWASSTWLKVVKEVRSAASSSCQSKQKTANQPANRPIGHSLTASEMKIAHRLLPK